MNQSVIQFGPIEYTQMNESEQILIVSEFRTELTSDEYYTVEVRVESIGVVRVKRKIIGTVYINLIKYVSLSLLHDYLDTSNSCANMTAKNEPEYQSTTLEKTNREPSTSDSALAAAAALGAIACLSCFITIILVVIFVIQRRKGNSGKSYMNMHDSVKNNYAIV